MNAIVAGKSEKQAGAMVWKIVKDITIDSLSHTGGLYYIPIEKTDYSKYQNVWYLKCNSKYEHELPRYIALGSLPVQSNFYMYIRFLTEKVKFWFNNSSYNIEITPDSLSFDYSIKSFEIGYFETT